MPYHDPSEGSWEFDRDYARDLLREPQRDQPRPVVSRDDGYERAVLNAGLTTAYLEDEDGIDAPFDRAMDRAIRSDGAR